jgi:uncharacterized oligopeptide transporter (OPT) family protein
MADKYWNSVALMVIGGTLGILFVTLLRRVMVEDPDLPFPESVAASEIHKAGQQGSKAAKILFANMGFGGFLYLLGAVNVFSPSNTFTVNIGDLGKRLLLRTSTNPRGFHHHRRRIDFHRAGRQPRVSRRRLHHRSPAGRAELCRWRARLGIAGSAAHLRAGTVPSGGATRRQPISWTLLAQSVYFSIVRPIAVGGMLVGASYTLFRMRKQLERGWRAPCPI